MNRSTLVAISRALKCTHRGSDRKAIEHVRIAAVGESVRITATNGHILSDIRIEDKDFAERLSNAIYFVKWEARPTVKNILKILKHCPNVPVQKLPSGAIEIGAEGVGFTIDTAAVCEIEYPDFEKIIPNEVVGRKSICFDAAYLLKLARTFELPKDSPKIIIDVGEHNECLIIRSGIPNDLSACYLMPCRILGGL